MSPEPKSGTEESLEREEGARVGVGYGLEWFGSGLMVAARAFPMCRKVVWFLVAPG